jgi:hypothetical protein
MQKLSREEIKSYVKSTIKTGNKARIKKVLARYQVWLQEQKNDQYETAKKIFGA